MHSHRWLKLSQLGICSNISFTVLAQSRGEHLLPSAAFVLQNELASQELTCPHSQLAKFGFVPLSFGHTWAVEHLLRDEVQKRPLVVALLQEPVSPHSQAAEFSDAPSSFGQTCTAEHLLKDEEQKRPLLELHIFVPQTQVSELVDVPSVSEQAEMAEDEHWLYVLLQNIPLNELHALVPQEQSTPVLINAPLLLEQALPREQVLLEELQ